MVCPELFPHPPFFLIEDLDDVLCTTAGVFCTFSSASHALQKSILTSGEGKRIVLTPVFGPARPPCHNTARIFHQGTVGLGGIIKLSKEQLLHHQGTHRPLLAIVRVPINMGNRG